MVAAPPPLTVAGKDPNSFPPSEPAQIAKNDPTLAARLPILTKGPHTLATIVRGCKLWVERSDEPEPRRAEILSVRERSRARTRGREAGTVTPGEGESRLEYYLHYIAYNKRLDEWVPGARLLLDREVEWPLPPLTETTPPTATNLSRTSTGLTPGSSGTSTPQKVDYVVPVRKDSMLRKAVMKAAGQKRLPPPELDADGYELASSDREEEEEEDGEGEVDESAVVAVEMMDEEDAEGELDPDTPDGSMLQEPVHFSKEQEIEKLRTQGSMTQSVHEIARVKNLDKIQIGRHEVEAWYFSPYPIE